MLNNTEQSRNALKKKRVRLRASRVSGTMSLAVMAKEYIWLWDVRHGIGTHEIAIREGVSVRRVQFGVSRAKAQEKASATNPWPSACRH